MFPRRLIRSFGTLRSALLKNAIASTSRKYSQRIRRKPFQTRHIDRKLLATIYKYEILPTEFCSKEIEVMIDEEARKKVKRINKKCKSRLHYNPRRIASVHLLSGIIYYSHCGKPMWAQIDSRRKTPRRFYVFPNRSKRQCSFKSIPKQLI
jgi:hypothetical protein